MKALTIKAPWAQAIVHGTKRIENRTWKPHQDVMGERIAIHCGKSMARVGDYEGDALAQLAKLQHKHLRHERGERTVEELGHIIGTARVVGYVDAASGLAESCAVGLGMRVQEGYDVTNGSWWLGPIGWLLDDVRPVEPVPTRGMPGLWKVKQELVEVSRG